VHERYRRQTDRQTDGRATAFSEREFTFAKNRLHQALDALVDWENTWQLSISVNKCSVLSIGKRTETLSSLNVQGHLLPINKSSVDLGVTMCDDLKPRANATLRCFVSKNINTLKRGFSGVLRATAAGIQ